MQLSFETSSTTLSCFGFKDGPLLYSPRASVPSEVLFGAVVVADIHCIARLERERAFSDGKNSDQTQHVNSPANHVFKGYL